MLLSGFLASPTTTARMVPAAIEQLKEDFKGENADAREEDFTRSDYERRLEAAKQRLKKDPDNPELKLQCAEGHAVIDPNDKTCFQLMEEMLQVGVNSPGVSSLDLQRQGDFWYLYGRSLFLADRIDESYLAFSRSRKYYKEKGTRALRKRTNCALLRVHAALGKSKLAAERLEVALTMCDNPMEACLLYMHAKNALEHTGSEKDAEVLDDIWYVELDTNEELRAKFEEVQSMSKSVLSQTASGRDEDDAPLTWKEFKRHFRHAYCEMFKDPTLKRIFPVMFFLWLASLVVLIGLRLRFAR
mmetsp:Transcript_41262/g.113809  ORF Transcript_41262/g.113809 Transcript_41262/m.113809 type:complete len:301 (-) Transcript_41262:92-994(-)